MKEIYEDSDLDKEESEAVMRGCLIISLWFVIIIVVALLLFVIKLLLQ